MNTIEQYHPSINPQHCLQVVKDEGAILLQKFIDKPMQDAITTEVSQQELTNLDKSTHAIAEQFDYVAWDSADETPGAIAQLGNRIQKLVTASVPEWRINSIRAQLYSPGQVGIDWHRDYERDLRVIAVASFLSSSLFEVRLNSQEHQWQLQPGDVVLMRGMHLNGRRDERPQHKIHAPSAGQRLSVTYRQFVDTAPKSEQK